MNALHSIATVVLIVAAPTAFIYYFARTHLMEGTPMHDDDEYTGSHRTEEELVYERWPSGYLGKHRTEEQS